MSEPAEEKIARLTRERDEMATQASACAEEVDRVRVEIGAVQAENDRLSAALAESERKRVEVSDENGKLRAMVGFNEPGGEPTDGTQIEVLDKRQMRWKPYSVLHRKQSRKSGRWQHHTGFGWENCTPPSGPWRALYSATPTQETSHVES